MRIVFYGDSLVEGVPGVPFLRRLESKLPQHRLINRGQGGDTVLSLLRRIADEPPRSSADLAVVWVGVNDVLAKLTFGHAALKRLMRQPWARDPNAFGDAYARIVQQLHGTTGRILAIAPLLIGEDPSNRWNEELAELGRIIDGVAASVDGVDFLDLRGPLLETSLGTPSSDYLPRSVTRIAFDSLFVRSAARIDQVAVRRGLRFTLDGVHLNSAGAEVVSEIIGKAIGDRD